MEDKRLIFGKKKILSILQPHLELQSDIYNVKLYSCDKEGKNWLFSDVEGFLCLIIDYNLKTKYIVIYHETTFEKLFQYELYNNFSKCFIELAPDFRSFEIDSGFMGIQFDIKEDAEKFDQLLKRVSGLANDLFAKPRHQNDDAKINNEKASHYCKMLKEKFGTSDKYDENYAEDGTTICKHKNFKILNNITYEKETKQFKFGKISEELRQMFYTMGIKRKDLANDTEFAFTIFKNLIVGLGNENKLKNNSTLASIEHVFPPPEERERLRRAEEAAEAKMNSIRNKKVNTKRKNTKMQPNPAVNKPTPATKKTSAPTPTPAPTTTSSTSSGSALPPPPPPPPPMPSGFKSPSNPSPAPAQTPKVEEPVTVVKEEQPEESDMAKEIANFKFKKVVVKENTSNDKMIQGSCKNFLQNALSTAIRNRRNNLHMHDEDEEEDEEDDWD